MIECNNVTVKTIYFTLKNIIIPKLKEMGKYAEIIPLPLSYGGTYWVDYAGDYMDQKCGTKDWYNNYVYFTIYLDQEGDNINMNRTIKVSYSLMNADEKRKIIKLFNDHLHKYFEWNGRNTHIIEIHYEKLDVVPEINLDKLKDDDVYPELYMSIEMIQNDLLDTGIDHLNVTKVINGLFPEHHIDLEHGKNDISCTIYSVKQKDMKKYLYPLLLNALDAMKEDNDSTQKIKSYNIYYYLDGNTEVDLD